MSEHILILKAFDEIPFSVGRKTMIDFVKGGKNSTIEKHNLSKSASYGIMKNSLSSELDKILNFLLEKKLIEYKTINSGFQVLRRTIEGDKEISERQFNYEKESIFNIDTSKITEDDRKIFSQFSFFLKGYNDEQKKSILSPSKSILCIAGAGTGKTSVLTKRTEFLVKFKGVEKEKILAVTFTKKAKKEMETRINSSGIDVNVETFNSFCEKILRKFPTEVYGKEEMRVAGFTDKIKITRKIIEKLKIDTDEIFKNYFTKKQLIEKNSDELLFAFVNDIFSIIDFYKNREKDISEFYIMEKNSFKKSVARKVYLIVTEIKKEMKKSGLRDFSDQIFDVLKLFRERKNLIPKFEHILIDEFQDLNYVQYELLKILSPENIFVVGDPRQAIYGWRGSDLNYISKFTKDFGDCETISLKINYRSIGEIVDVFNSLIRKKGFDNLIPKRKSEEGSVFLLEQDNEISEKVFVAEAIKNSKNSGEEIFVLARTNKIIESFSDYFGQQKIEHIIKSEGDYGFSEEPQKGKVTLATIHSIKGMEAKEVYLVGANNLSFPNKVQDNYVLSLVKNSWDYDKEEEELRLFYVALSRAKDKLVITYTGSKSIFISDEMIKSSTFKQKNKTLDLFSSPENSYNSEIVKDLLRAWRTKKSNETGLPSYMIISNATMDDIILKKPKRKSELKLVKGFGDVKVEKYGDEILEILLKE